MRAKILFCITFLLMAEGTMAGQTQRVAEDESQKIRTAYLSLNPEDMPKVRERAEAGNSTSQILLGLAYQDDASQILLGIAYRGGAVQTVVRLVPENQAEAAKWLRKAAEQGSALAQFFLGNLYRNGQGVPRDLAEAVRLWRMSAEQGYAPAQSQLGEAFQAGRGVARDQAEAAKWYRKAAEQGDLSAQCFLAMAYDKGEGVGMDKLEAAKWWTKAAEQGDFDSAFHVGQVYARGQGLPAPDPQKAYMWFIITDKLLEEEINPAMAGLALGRDPSLSLARAEAMRKEMERQSSRAKKMLSQEQLRQAEQQAQEWLKEHRPPRTKAEVPVAPLASGTPALPL